MAGPFVAAAAIRDAQVIDLALLSKSQSRATRLVGHRIQRADFVALAPNPAPACALLPALDRAGCLVLPSCKMNAGEPAGRNEERRKNRQAKRQTHGSTSHVGTSY